MEIREIDLKDLNNIKQEYMDYFNTYEEAEWTIQKVEKRFHQLVKRYDYVGIGCYDNNKLIGFAVGALSQFDDGIVTLLNELFIIKSYQSKGYGSKLLKEYERISKEKGAFLIQLESANDEIHRRFYNEIHDFKDASNNILKSKLL